MYTILPQAEVPPDETGAISPGATLHSITKQVPSPRAILGKAVEQAMTKGKSVPINIMTDVVVLGIRYLVFLLSSIQLPITFELEISKKFTEIS